MLPREETVSLRDILIIVVFIGSICFVTLTPAMYLAFHALQWQGALRVVELVFPPALLLAIAAGLLAYQRSQVRRAEAWDRETSYEERT